MVTLILPKWSNRLSIFSFVHNCPNKYTVLHCWTRFFYCIAFFLSWWNISEIVSSFLIGTALFEWGQTVHFVICKRIPQQRCSLFLLFVFFFISSDHLDKILAYFKRHLWKPGIYRHKIVRLSSAQFYLVMWFTCFFLFPKLID